MRVDVDMSHGVVRLELTKSGKRREIPMRQVVYDTLAARRTPGSSPTGRVFGVRSIRAPFDTAASSAGLDDLRFHDLRHHFAPHFMMRGGQLLTLQRILGHASLAMTTRYAHLSPDHVRGEMMKTDRSAQNSAQGSEEPVQSVVSPRR